MRSAWLLLLAGCAAPSKWAEVGVTDPISVRMMDEWERRRLESDKPLKEWAIDYSPGRRHAVIYRLYGEREEETTLTYFRIEKGTPVFVRHDVWPDMVYGEVGDDGSSVVLEFNCAALRWTSIDPANRRRSGWLLCWFPGLEAAADGSFLVTTGLEDYRLRVGPDGTRIARERFRDDVVFRDNGALDGQASLPEGLSPEEVRAFKAYLAEARDAVPPDGPGGRYLRAYAAAALATGDWTTPRVLPGVRSLLQELAEKR